MRPFAPSTGRAPSGMLKSVESPRTLSHTFTYRNATAKSVSVKGSFNDWQPLLMKRDAAGVWNVVVPSIEEGTYVYTLEVDGRTQLDPSNPKQNVKPGGETSSVLDVGGGDYPVPYTRQGTIEDDPSELVVVTLNTHSLQEKTQRFKKLEWIAEGLAAVNADLIGLNETVSGKIYARGYQGRSMNTAELIQSYLEELTGASYHRYEKTMGIWGDGEHLNNVILSRYPIEEQSERKITTTDKWPAPNQKRNVLFAKVRLPGGQPVHFYVTHAMGWISVDTASQIKEIKSFMDEHYHPEVLAEFVVGDLNVVPTHPQYPDWLRLEPAMRDTYATINKIHHPYRAETVDYIMLSERSSIGEVERSADLIFNNESVGGHLFPKVSDHVGFVTRIKIPK